MPNGFIIASGKSLALDHYLAQRWFIRCYFHAFHVAAKEENSMSLPDVRYIVSHSSSLWCGCFNLLCHHCHQLTTTLLQRQCYFLFLLCSRAIFKNVWGILFNLQFNFSWVGQWMPNGFIIASGKSLALDHYLA